MSLVSMRDLLAEARAGNYAVGYFEAWDQYSLEAVLEAAEAVRSPVILGFGCEVIDQAWLDQRGLAGWAALGRAIVETAQVPAAYLLNEAHTLEQVQRGLAGGFNAVMMDSSGLPFHENVATTRRVVQAARAAGADVEGALGHLPDASGAMSHAGPPTLTDPDEAARFVAATGIDALAVSIGNVHTLSHGHAPVDLAHLAAVAEAVDVPLVIHGGTGFPDDAVPQAIACGVAKFNVGTVLKRAFLEGVQEALGNLTPPIDYHALVGSRKADDFLNRGKDRLRTEVIRRMRGYRSAGKA